MSRVFVTLLSISILSAAIATLASALLHQSTIMAEAETELGHECQVIASTLNASDDEVAELQRLELGEMRATLVTPEGAVLFDSVVATTGLVGHGTRPEIAEALANGTGSSVRASDTVGYISIYQARRLDSGNVLRLSVDRAGVFSILLGDLGILGLVLVGLAIFSWFASRKLAAGLVQPILEIDVSRLSLTAPYEELQPLTDRLAEQQAELVSQMEELKSADTMRREFTANVTHELKTPIASIMGASELMRDGYVLDEDVPGFAARINDESQRLSALVNDILTLSRLDESERAQNQGLFGQPELVNLLPVARDVCERMGGRADHAEVSINLDGTPCLVRGFPRIIDELVANLCSNAIRYNKPGGEVNVFVGPVDGLPTVRVSDTGIGIPEESQGKVFERFYRVEASRSRASGGTGLGLAIVKHAAMLHGADVSLESEVGKGTTITVSFPAVDASEAIVPKA
ncbi:MAG: two-component sensor histidine kinase [Atopobiaceae bacterium]|nr:two-component sensor histidine kinase [Atopobiaceae bacterium]